MNDYSELVKFLRGLSPWAFPDASNKRMLAAADAIEALDRLLDQNTKRCEALRKQLREAHENYEKHLNELEAQLEDRTNVAERWKDMYLTKNEPKRGEWIEENRRPRSSQFVCSECHRTAYDPQPTRDKAWRKRCRYAYCPNCGAKMEVQDGK